MDNLKVLTCVGAALAAALIAFFATPLVIKLAHKAGAIDVPKDERRMHKTPIPRMGGLAIFLGFLVSILIFADIDRSVRGTLLGSVIIVALGIVDDIKPVKAVPKLIVQLIAAVVAVLHGVTIPVLSNPLGDGAYFGLGLFSIPVTIIWIAAITNAVNLIDGLDGLAAGVSAISSISLVVIALLFSEPNIALIMIALAGACIGFLPHNRHPAKIFMGDTGSAFLGFVLACMSVQGVFKFYTLVTFFIPFIIIGLPIFDTSFAFLRRLLTGKSPFQADRGHVHHKLIDLGLNQKQSVAILYAITCILGLLAVLITTKGPIRWLLAAVALVLAAAVVLKLKKQHQLYCEQCAKRECAQCEPQEVENDEKD